MLCTAFAILAYKASLGLAGFAGLTGAGLTGVRRFAERALAQGRSVGRVRRPPLHRLRCRRGAEAPLSAARPTRG